MKIFIAGQGEVQSMSKIIVHTSKEKPTGAVAASDIILARGGYVEKEAAGIFTLLPMGLRVKRNVEKIIRN